MIKIFQTLGKSLIFGIVFVLTLFWILYLGFPFARILLSPAKAEALDTNILKTQMEQLFDLSSYEYKYNTIITRSKIIGQAGGLTIGEESKLLIRAKGVVKAGCKVQSITQKDGHVLVTISEPIIIESYVLSMNTIHLVDTWYNKFDITEDKDAADKVHIQIEKTVFDEVVKGATERSKNILSGFLVSSGIQSDSIQFEVE